MAIAEPDDLRESEGPGADGRVWQVCVRSASFLQNIARADVPWSAVWRGSRRAMDTNRCHRASRYALEARRMTIAVPGELQERVGPGADGCAWQVGELTAKSSRERMCPGGT